MLIQVQMGLAFRVNLMKPWKRNVKQDTLHLDRKGGSFKSPLTALHNTEKCDKTDSNKTS
jgi:hypothetical protein